MQISVYRFRPRPPPPAARPPQKCSRLRPKAFGEEVHTRQSRLRSFCEYKPTAFVGALRRMGECLFAPKCRLGKEGKKRNENLHPKNGTKKNKKIFSRVYRSYRSDLIYI